MSTRTTLSRRLTLDLLGRLGPPSWSRLELLLILQAWLGEHIHRWVEPVREMYRLDWALGLDLSRYPLQWAQLDPEDFTKRLAKKMGEGGMPSLAGDIQGAIFHGITVSTDEVCPRCEYGILELIKDERGSFLLECSFCSGAYSWGGAESTAQRAELATSEDIEAWLSEGLLVIEEGRVQIAPGGWPRPEEARAGRWWSGLFKGS